MQALYVGERPVDLPDVHRISAVCDALPVLSQYDCLISDPEARYALGQRVHMGMADAATPFYGAALARAARTHAIGFTGGLVVWSDESLEHLREVYKGFRLLSVGQRLIHPNDLLVARDDSLEAAVHQALRYAMPVHQN